jgi:hypothetical protein
MENQSCQCTSDPARKVALIMDLLGLCVQWLFERSHTQVRRRDCILLERRCELERKHDTKAKLNLHGGNGVMVERLF